MGVVNVILIPHLNVDQVSNLDIKRTKRIFLKDIV